MGEVIEGKHHLVSVLFFMLGSTALPAVGDAIGSSSAGHHIFHGIYSCENSILLGYCAAGLMWGELLSNVHGAPRMMHICPKWHPEVVVACVVVMWEQECTGLGDA